MQHNLGTTYLRCWEVERTAEYLEAAIAALSEAFASFQDLGLVNRVVQVGRTLGLAYQRARQWEWSADTFAAVCDGVDILYEASLLLSSKRAVLADTAGVFSLAAYALARAGRLTDAVVAAERGRARLLGGHLARHALVELAGVDPDGFAALSEAAERVRTAEAAERTLATTSGGRRVWDTTARETELSLADDAKSACAAFTAALARVAHARVEGFGRPSIEEIARASGPQVPLAYVLTTEVGTLTLLVQDTTSVPTIQSPVTAIWDDSVNAKVIADLLVRAEGRRITGGYLPGQDQDDERWLDDALAKALPLLGAHIAGPLAALLAERRCTGVVLIPCGDLGLFPLHSAPYAAHQLTSCLIDAFDVAVAPSARVLNAQRRASGGESIELSELATPVLAGVGNPLAHQFPPLPWASAELGSIAALFDQQHQHTLYEDAATVEKLLGLLPGATHLHLACHGVFRPDEPMESFLVMAGDDRLTLRAIIGARALQDVRLVVASACQTAVGDYLSLPDEMLTVASGFLYAGATWAIGSLWPVDDLATALLMHRFYLLLFQPELDENLGTATTPAAALRHAQRWLRGVSSSEVRALLTTSGFERTYATLPERETRWLEDHLQTASAPFAASCYWAPWVLVGPAT